MSGDRPAGDRDPSCDATSIAITSRSAGARTEEAQNATGPVTVCLLAAYFLAMAVSGVPDSLGARLASWFPLTAPLVMPSRLVLGHVPVWEMLLAVALTAAAVYGLLRVGGRIYAGAILHSGRRVRLHEAWRATEL